MATSPFPFPYQAAPPPFPAAASYSPNSPNPTQIHGYHHPSPFFYPSPTQIHGGLYPPPPYSGDYCSAPLTHLYPTPFLPNPCYQVHAPPPESTPSTFVPPPPPPLGYSTEAATTLHQVQRELLNIQARLHSAMLKSRVSQCPASTGKRSTSASMMQLDHAPVPLNDHAQMLKLRDSEVNAFQHHNTLPSISASKMANAGVPDGLIAMEPSKASRTAEGFPVLCTDECTDQKDAEKSGSVLHHATPAALPDHKPLLLLQEGKVDAIQRHTTGLYLGRLPSSSTTNKTDVAVLSHSRIDSAPEVFGEMPISGTGYVYCSGHHNISLNTCVLDRNSNLSEQNMDGMPQAYGFHNLNCKSVVLEPMFAVYEDETDSSSSEFFDVSATPTDRLQSQPFEQLPVFNSYDDDTDGSSTESVGVFTSKPELQQYEEKHQEDVLDLPLELQQQDDEKACNVPVLKASDSVVTSSNKLSIDHSMRELRLLWDPGSSAFLVAHNFSSNGKTDILSQFEHLFIVLRGVFEEVMLEKQPAEPPARVGIADPSLQVILLEVQKSENSSAHTHFNFLSCNSTQTSDVQDIEDICFLLEAIPSGKQGASSVRNFAIPALWCDINQVGDKIFVGLHIAAILQKLFPGISRSNTENICIFVKLSPWNILSAQLFQDSSMKMCSTFSSGCILPWNQWYAILLLHHFLTSVNYADWVKHKVQYCCLQFLLACPYSVRACYSSMFSSTEAIHSARSMSTATTMCVLLILGSVETIEENDVVAVYQVSKIQLQMRKTTHVWDPGIGSLLSAYIWLHINKTQLVDCTSTAANACYLVPASLQWEFLHQQGIQKNYNTKKSALFTELSSDLGKGYYLHYISTSLTWIN